MLKKGVSLLIVFCMTFLMVVSVIPVQAAPADFTEVWKDDFTPGENLTANWNIINEGGGFGNQEKQFYRPDNIALTTKDGVSCLAITAKKENYNGHEYTSGKLTTQGKHDYTYGRFEMRAKLPGVAQGAWPAFWMLPSDISNPDASRLYGGWPIGGEIDIMENVQRSATLDVTGKDAATTHSTIHYGDPHSSSGKSYTLPSGILADQWHTYAVEWLPNRFDFYIDNILVHSVSDWFSRGVGQSADYTYNAPFDRNFFMILNLAVGGVWPGDPDPAAFSNPASYPTFYVDYVKYSRYNGALPAAGSRPGPTGGDTGTARAPLADGNLIYNGDFSSGNTNNWTFNQLSGGVGAVQVVNGEAKVTATNGGSQGYSIQLLQDQFTLEPLQNYRVTFNARADAPRSIGIKVGEDGTRAGHGWNNYSGDRSFGLNGTTRTYSFDFTMNSPRDTSARLEFNLGYSTIPVYIDNVKIQSIGASSVARPYQPDTNLLYNGTFDQGANRQVFWSLINSNGAAATANAGAEPANRQATINITNAGTADSSIKYQQSPITLEKGASYTVSFDAKANSARNITANVTNASGGVYGSKSFALNSTMTNYTYTFNMNSATDKTALFYFGLGGNASAVTIDNVRVYRTPRTFPVKNVSPDGELIVNGNFNSNADYWNYWSDVGGGVMCSSYTESGKLRVDMGNDNGINPWDAQISQNTLPLQTGANYTVKFDAYSTIARPMQVMIEINGAPYTKYMVGNVNLTTTSKTYTINFKQIEDRPDAHLVFCLGPIGNTSISTAHSIFLDNVSVAKNNTLGQAGTLSFSPAPGRYTTAQNVAINGAATGATIKYTLDGTDPNADSQTYTGPISVNSKGVTIKAYAYKAGITDSAPITGTYSVIPVVNVPGQAEAEDFFDMSGVVVEGCGEGGLDLGFIDTGDWMDYNINVPVAGKHLVEFRVASGTGGGRIQLLNASNAVLATMDVPNTGGWQNWITFGTYANLPAGIQKVRVSAATGGFNLNWIKFASHPVAANAPIPGTIEAEDYTAMNGISIQPSIVEGGYNVCYIDNGDWMDYSVNVQTAGSYTISYRVANGGTTPGQIQLMEGATVLSATSVPGTGDWQNWQVVTSTVNLTAGNHIFRVYAATGGFNLNWINFSLPGGQVATPTLTPAAGIYTTAQNVTISCATVGATIKYTTDGSTPTASSPTYTEPIRVAATTTIKAYALKTGMTNSNMVSATYTIQAGQAETPTFTPVAGTYASAQSVTLECATAGATIKYTTDGSTPTASSPTYTGAINVANTTTIKAYAVKAGMTDSSVASATYTINIPTGKAIPGKIEAESYDAMLGIQTENCGDTGAGLNVGWIDTGDYMDYNVNVAAAGSYTVEFRVASPNGGGSIQIRNGATTLSTTAVPNTTGWQTWQTATASVSLTAGTQTLRIYANSGGFNLNWINFSSNTVQQVATPTFTPAAGTYGSAQNVTIACSTEGATIRYTTNGTEPMASSAQYTAPINVASTTTIKAKAFKSGMTDSATASAAYIINIPTGKAIPGKIEAESYDAMLGIQTENCGDTGAGLNVGWIDAGDYMDYNVNVATAGNYTVEFRVASPNTTGSIQLMKGATVLSTTAVPNTTGWQTWQTVTANVNLTAGAQTLRVYANGGGFNFNWINFIIANPNPVNLALSKTATSSPIEANFVASAAVDGNTATRWASEQSDPQWICVDLGASYNISKVVLNWEAAYGKAYTIQVSTDGNTWTDVFSTTTGDGGVDTITFPSRSAKYVRMSGTQRGTIYGYSLYEFEVY